MLRLPLGNGNIHILIQGKSRVRPFEWIDWVRHCKVEAEEKLHSRSRSQYKQQSWLLEGRLTSKSTFPISMLASLLPKHSHLVPSAKVIP